MEKHRLYLSDSDKKIAGVCGGFGEFFGVDSTVLRLAFLFALIFGGSGFLLYLVCWAVVPKRQNADGVFK